MNRYELMWNELKSKVLGEEDNNILLKMNKLEVASFNREAMLEKEYREYEREMRKLELEARMREGARR